MAALVAQVVIDRARVLLKDNPVDSLNRRWSDEELMRWINDGHREIITRRSDMYSVSDEEYTGTSIPPLSDIAVGGDLKIHSANVHILLDYIMSRAFGKDSEEGDVLLAKSYTDNFEKKMVTV